ncbi:MAG: GlsB/YeaQ/YmgE family stress response membrane protein [Pirellulales bacterium]
MQIIGLIVVGFIVGVIAKFLMPGRDPKGCLITILLGIGGSFTGSKIGQTLGWYQEGQPAGWIMSIVGAMILLVIYRLILGRQASDTGP